MADFDNLDTYIDDIRRKRYGKEVRAPIANALSAIKGKISGDPAFAIAGRINNATVHDYCGNNLNNVKANTVYYVLLETDINVENRPYSDTILKGLLMTFEPYTGVLFQIFFPSNKNDIYWRKGTVASSSNLYEDWKFDNEANVALKIGGGVTDANMSRITDGTSVSFNNAESGTVINFAVETQYGSISDKPFEDKALQGLLVTLASAGNESIEARKHQLYLDRRSAHIYWRFVGLNPEDTSTYIWGAWKVLATTEDMDSIRDEVSEDIEALRTEIKPTVVGLLRDGLLPYETMPGYYRKTGVRDTNANYESAVSEFAVSPGEVYRYKGRGGDPDDPGSLPAAALFYDANGGLLSAVQYTPSAYHEITVPENAARAIFASLRNVSSGQVEIFELEKVGSTLSDLKKLESERLPMLEEMKDRLAQDGLFPMKTVAGFFKANGTRDTSARYETIYSDLTVTPGEVYRYRGRGGGDAVSYLFFDADGDVLENDGYGQFSPSGYHEITVPENAVRAIFASMRNVTSADQARVFELEKTGTTLYTVKTRTDKIPQIEADLSIMRNPTLNAVNRLYAAETMGQSKTLLPLEKGVVCIGFDDYNLDCLKAVRYLNGWDEDEGTESGIHMPCYLALIPDKVTDNWNMAKECYIGGGEICAHSLEVLTNKNQTFEMMNEKFVHIPEQIGAAGFPVYGIIRAGGNGQGDENTALDEFYCRAAGLKYSDYYGDATQYTLGRYNMTRRTLAEWRTRLNEVAANKDYEIIFCHHVNGTETNSYPGGFTFSDFKALIAEIASRDIDVMTINGFVDKYIYGIDPTDGFVRDVT